MAEFDISIGFFFLLFFFSWAGFFSAGWAGEGEAESGGGIWRCVKKKWYDKREGLTSRHPCYPHTRFFFSFLCYLTRYWVFGISTFPTPPPPSPVPRPPTCFCPRENKERGGRGVEQYNKGMQVVHRVQIKGFRHHNKWKRSLGQAFFFFLCICTATNIRWVRGHVEPCLEKLYSFQGRWGLFSAI